MNINNSQLLINTAATIMEKSRGLYLMYTVLSNAIDEVNWSVNILFHVEILETLIVGRQA